MGAAQQEFAVQDYDILILALLSERNDYGYRLANRIDAFCEMNALQRLPNNEQRVYQALKRLEDRCAITRVVPSNSGIATSRRNMFGVLDRGIAELREYIAEPIGHEPSRAEILVRLNCMKDAEDAEALLGFLVRWELTCLERLEALGPPVLTSQGAFESFASALAGSASRHLLSAQLGWLTDAKQQLRRLIDPDRRRP